jgi:hypothetical protein
VLLGLTVFPDLVRWVSHIGITRVFTACERHCWTVSESDWAEKRLTAPRTSGRWLPSKIQ